MNYYNTTNLQGAELAESVEQTKSQSARIYKIMKRKGYNMTPVEVHAEYCKLHKPCPLTSIRRSLTDMTTDGLLFKSDEKGEGLYGKDNFKWGVAFKEEKTKKDMNFFEKLKEYFKGTPKEEIIAKWESTSKFDEVNSPTMDEFLNNSLVQQKMQTIVEIEQYNKKVGKKSTLLIDIIDLTNQENILNNI